MNGMRGSKPRFILKVLLWAVAFFAALIALAWWASQPKRPDAFYDAPPTLPKGPGRLIRSEPFTRDLPPGARGWRILYTTTRWDGSPGVASAVVVASEHAPDGARPVLAWAHGTTGIMPGCAPSLAGRPFANVPGFDAIVGEGWAYVATDYAGLGTGGGHAYLIGEDAARSVLDSVRAARALNGLRLDGRMVVWGHSQGGHSALWTGMRAGAYAPELRLLGVAAFAPASDLPALISAQEGLPFGKIVSSYILHGYDRAYPDVAAGDYLEGPGEPVSWDLARRCVTGWGTLFSIVEAKLLPGKGIFARDPASGPLGARLAQNTPNGPIAAPVLIGQGGADDLILASIQSRYVAGRCAAGQPIDYRIYPGLDHGSLVENRSPLAGEALRWTSDRLAGRAAADNCERKAAR